MPALETDHGGSRSPVLVLTECGTRALEAESRHGHLLAVLDATDAPEVPQKAAEMGPERAPCLYRGRTREELWVIAPYLAQVDEEMLKWLRGTLWGQPWGVFAVSGSGLEAVYAHLRRFLVVEDPQGQSLLFRFYDPRVMAMYLPTCSPRQLSEVFGPIERFVFAPDPSCPDALQAASLRRLDTRSAAHVSD